MSTFKVVRPDGVSSSQNTTYSIASEEVFIYGLVEGYDSIEITYLNSTFTSVGDEADITINEDGTWVFPNSAEGIDLNQGANLFSATAYSSNGNASLNLTIVLPEEIEATLPEPPLNVKVERGAQSVDISWVHTDSSISHYLVYASTTSGGGARGYTRINAAPIDPISYGKTNEKVTLISSVEADVTPELADPLIVEVLANQSDISTSSIGSVEVPENTKRLRISSSVSATNLETRVSFKHNRANNLTSSPPTIQVGEFSILKNTEPLYYVVSAVKFVDELTLESSFSVEVAGYPIDIQASNLSLPVVTDDQLTEELIASIYSADPDASVQAGSAIRDLFIDPLVSELSRTRFVLDFSYRATNFVSLLYIDDPLNSGVSIGVQASGYKQTLKDALFLDTDTQVQNLIDACFDRLASNMGITRRAGVKARGEVVFYTKSAPTFDLFIPRSTIISNGVVSFRVTSPGQITQEGAPSAYNPLTRLYEITLPIEAVNAGISGNLTSGKITQGAPLGLKVINRAPTFGGLDRETNQELTSRSMSYISSVDVGTRAGYERLARESAGVKSYNVEGANSPYMVRDEGLGGKVDVWVRGEVLNEVTDVYAPSYLAVRGARFAPLDSEGAYKFLATTASDAKPLFQMIDREGEFGLYNQTSGEWFDLTGAQISEGKILTLDRTLAQPTYRLTDTILGDYRSDVTDKIVLERQPVRSITSVKKADGSDVPYTFYKPEDPLRLGQSTSASDYIIIPNDATEKIISISQEEVTFNGIYPETLLNKGVDITSIVVQHVNKTSPQDTPYVSPLRSSSPDYLISTSSEGITSIQRTSTSAIGEFEKVYVSYDHLENVVVTYVTNLVVSTLQATLDEKKHMGADVIVKEVLSAPVDIQAVVFLEKGASPSEVDSVIRSNVATRIESEGQGGSIHPSDIIREIDSVSRVSHVKTPLSKLALSPGVSILRERVITTSPQIVSLLTSSSHQVWLGDVPLAHVPASAGGGTARAFLDGEEIPILSVNQRTLASNWGQTCASIVGREGVSINQNGIFTEVSDATQKLMLALPLGTHPNDYKIELNYTTGEASGYAESITLNQFSYMTSGTFSFTYEEVK
jgi:hypothetical protein